MIGSVFGVPALLDLVGEEVIKDMLSTFSCVSDGVQLNEDSNCQRQDYNYYDPLLTVFTYYLLLYFQPVALQTKKA